MNPEQQARGIVARYNQDPKQYTDSQAKQIAFLAYRLNLPFKPESKALEKFAFDIVDNALFGLLPDSTRPVSRGEEFFGETSSESAARNVANIGYLAPLLAGGGAGFLAQSVAKGAGMGLAARGAIGGAVGGAGIYGLPDFAEDPSAAAGRALEGALLGGITGGVGGAYLGPAGNKGFLNMLSPRMSPNIGNVGVAL
tara:strand:+ start:206 stop:796 length:591 start_codon:yes stop_codon:yes gene_type:complete